MSLFLLAKSLTFIFRAQATILWRWLETKPTNPQGVTFSLDNVRQNAPWLFAYLNGMRWIDNREILLDAAGIGVSFAGLRLRVPLIFRITSVFGVRKWVQALLMPP